jgi:predicted DNA-binding protein YlxM (UPF0122 family)
MEQWLSIPNYAEVNGITTQAVYKRIKKGYITEDRIRHVKKNAETEREYMQIMLADIEDLKQ